MLAIAYCHGNMFMVTDDHQNLLEILNILLRPAGVSQAGISACQWHLEGVDASLGVIHKRSSRAPGLLRFSLQ